MLNACGIPTELEHVTCGADCLHTLLDVMSGRRGTAVEFERAVDAALREVVNACFLPPFDCSSKPYNRLCRMILGRRETVHQAPGDDDGEMWECCRIVTGCGCCYSSGHFNSIYLYLRIQCGISMSGPFNYFDQYLSIQCGIMSGQVDYFCQLLDIKCGTCVQRKFNHFGHF